jgi:hypothetical protein
VILLEHLHVRIFGETSFTDGGEVCGLPAGTVEVLFDLWGHDGAGSFGVEGERPLEACTFGKIRSHNVIMWRVLVMRHTSSSPAQARVDRGILVIGAG